MPAVGVAARLQAGTRHQISPTAGQGSRLPNPVKEFADGHEPRLLLHLSLFSSSPLLIFALYLSIKVCSTHLSNC